MSNVELTYPENNIDYDNPVEDFDYSIKQTYVWFKKADNHGEIKYFGPVLPVWKIPDNLDEVKVEEIFLAVKHYFNTTNDSVSLGEDFDARKTLEVLELFNDQIDIGEEFTKEHIKAIYKLFSDAVGISEVFSKELIEPVRKFAQDQIDLGESFDFETELTKRDNTSDAVSLNEVFDTNLIATINKFHEDSLSLAEVFDKEFISGDIEPKNVSSAEATGGDISISWDTPGAGTPDKYEIHYNVNGGNWNILDDNVVGTTTEYLHQGCGTDYSNNDDVLHRIRAVYPDRTSDWVEANNGTPVTLSGCLG